MGQGWDSNPTFTVTLNSVNVGQYVPSLTVRGKENGFDTATLNVSSTKGRRFFNAEFDVDDAVVIRYKNATDSDALYNTFFNGVIRSIEPFIENGRQYLKIECDGNGYGVGITQCAEEYGSESTHPTLDTIKEILEDNTNGVVPKWINKVLGTATDSGFSYTTQIETIAGTIPYIYFPYKTNTKAINDVCDVIQGIKGAAAGCHWIVDTSDRLILGTVGNHGAPASTYWATYWKTDAAGSTLTEGEDFLTFNARKLSKEANYVLYHGRFKKPPSEIWTENNSALWGQSAGALTITDDNTLYKVGNYSLRMHTTQNGGIGVMFYPASGTWGLDVTKLGGKHSFPSLAFYAMKNVEVTAYRAKIFFGNGAALWRSLTLTDDVWGGFNFSFGQYLNNLDDIDGWNYSGTPDWTDLSSIRFEAAYNTNTNNKYHWVDGVSLNGWVLRAARQAAAYTSAAPCKMRVITDEVGKDDSLVASDDSGLMARLAYAEYLRLSSNPIVGTITVPIMRGLKAGQLVHIHAWKKADNTYVIDSNFRVTRFLHNISDKATTTLEVTDDVLNSNPRPVPTQINSLLAAAKPEFQTRQSSSIKTREIDITQPILEKSY